jgi:acetyl-CoA acetyltransferase family protein
MGISREDQDAFAFASHQKAIAAQTKGLFRDEIVPVTAPKGRRDTAVIDADEGPRADTNMKKLGSLRAAFRDGGSVTAGNSSTLNDGASAMIIATADRAAELGLKPVARLVACAAAGVDPTVMGLGPVPATRKALDLAGWTLDDVELIELNEAFAAQSLGVIRELGLDESRVNVNGGAIALGHPLGCSGARILTTLIHAMHARGAKRGLATLCVGVGQGVSTLVEAIDG